MLKSVIGDELWAEMTEGQKLDAVFGGQATLKQLTEGLLDGSEKLRHACREFLADTDPTFENLPVGSEPNDTSEQTSASSQASSAARHEGHAWLHDSVELRITKSSVRAAAHSKPRFGLPEGFEPRRQRYGRGVLLELNIYRLANGQEFIPVSPSGTLGKRQHLYALVTTEQYLSGKRGSVYIRSDGRVFDYGVDNRNPSGDLFDTGYTIYDLERTGRYAPELKRKKKSQAKAKMKLKRVAAAR